MQPEMMIIIITAIDLDQVGPQERVRHMNLKILKITILIITPWAVANVKACGAKKSIGMVMVEKKPILSQSMALKAPGYEVDRANKYGETPLYILPASLATTKL